MLEKHVHPAIKDDLSFTTRSLLFCLLSALWHIDTLPTETVYNFVSFELSSFENSHQRCDVSVMWTLQPLGFYKHKFILTILPLNQTWRLWKQRKWSPQRAVRRTCILMFRCWGLHDTSPPDTGASRNVAPLPCTISPISLATAGSIVLVSINNDPGFTELQKLYVLFVTVTDISKFSLSIKQSPNIPKQTPEGSLMFLRGWGLQNKKSWRNLCFNK